MMTHCNQVKTRASPQLAVSVCSYYETHPSPCGRHLHCLHSWSRGQNSSALGAVSSQSQPVTCHVISLTRHTLADFREKEIFSKVRCELYSRHPPSPAGRHLQLLQVSPTPQKSSAFGLWSSHSQSVTLLVTNIVMCHV